MNDASIKPEEFELLSEIPLFSDMARDELAQFASSLRKRSYRKGEVISHDYDPPGSVFIVFQGTIKYRAISRAGRELTLAWYQKGDFFGARGIILGLSRKRDAVAVEDSELFIISAERFRDLLTSHPLAVIAVLDQATQHLRTANERLFDFAFLSASERLAKVLIELVDSQTLDAQHPYPYVRLNHYELAGLSGLTRESVGNCLKFFVDKGWIASQRGIVSILRPDLLHQHAEGFDS